MKVQEFTVTITEIRETKLTIEAENENKAIEMIENRYYDGDIMLDEQDITRTKINIIE